MAATLIQPLNDSNTINNNQVLTLLEGSSSSINDNSSSVSEDSHELTQAPSDEHHQEILDYLKPSPVSSCNSKKVPRLGPFLLLKTLGVGEFGKVKLGRHIETGQIVAVKLVKKQNIDTSSQLEKIRMEIDILKTLNHPYIVKLLSVNETNANIGMVLEYAQGGELFEYIFKQRYLKEQEACRLFSQLISSVYYMHQKNIVHRDLKLENILLDRHGNIIVTDFGFANQFTPKSGDLMSTSCGSPVYAAPELVMTGRLYAGTGVDIWSCGIILYAMLCGYLPFDDDAKNPNGENIGRLYRYIMAHRPKYPPYLSENAKDIIGKMLIPDPSERCKIEAIMSHPWLQDYKDQMAKSVAELEKEAQIKKQLLLTGIQSSTNLNILAAGEQYDSNEDCCANSDHDSCSTSSSVSSSYSYTNSYSNTKEARIDDILETGKLEPTSSSPSTPLPHTEEEEDEEEKNNDNISCSEKISPEREQAHAEQTSTNMPNALNDNTKTLLVTPVSTNEEATVADTKTTPNALKQADPGHLDATQRKRHTIDAAVTNALMQQQKTEQRTLPPRQRLSLRAKLFSTVKRRTNHDLNIEKPEGKSRHSWQHLMQSQSAKHLPFSTVASPTPAPTATHAPLVVEHSKSERLLSWLKKTKSLQHKKPKAIMAGDASLSSSTQHSAYSSSKEAAIPEEEALIPVAQPMRPTSAAPTMGSQSNGNQNSPQDHQVGRMSISPELRVHTGNMNHSALTSKPPMEVLLETNKILLILGIEVENLGGYKLRCTRRSIHSTDSNQQDEVSDVLNHLSTRNGTTSMMTQPIYGHPSIDKGDEIQFLVEICRFENLSGLFSVDIQNLATNGHNENFASYQFIGQKLLSLLQHGNVIRNTNFSLMLRKDIDSANENN